MEVDSNVWVKSKASKKNAKDGFWAVATVTSREVDAHGLVTLVVRDKAGNENSFTSKKGFAELEEIKPKNEESDVNIENLIELQYLNEPELLNSLKLRYFRRMVYTYTGNILIAINPLQALVPDSACEKFMERFVNDIKTVAVSVDDAAGPLVAKHHSIIINGESGSGKTEVAKLLTMHLIQTNNNGGGFAPSSLTSRGGFTPLSLSSRGGLAPLGLSDDEEEVAVEKDLYFRDDAMMLGSPVDSSASKMSSLSSSAKRKKKGNLYSSYQIATVERIKQATPIIEAFGNACTAHTHNSSRMGKYLQLSFNQGGDLVGGIIRTYLLEHVRVCKQLERERNFHIFYQLIAGASSTERATWAIDEAQNFTYTNQGGVTPHTALINDREEFLKLRLHVLGFEPDAVERVFSVVAGVLHMGQIEFSSISAQEGQVAIINGIEGAVGETQLTLVARLWSMSEEELASSLTVRSVLLNRELFKKALTPLQAITARDAISKSVYRKLVSWLVQELNAKLQPPQEIVTEVCSSVSILDIFGFDSFEMNSFEQLCINYVNEALQELCFHHMFKLELLEYKREGIPFEDIAFPDNQESLDLISIGVFKILDDQCRIPNATDKRFASQLYKDLDSNSKFSAGLAQRAGDMFCISHFAGLVVYATDKFIEKNLDNLPQTAAELLSCSRNEILSSDAPIVTAPVAEILSSDVAVADLPSPPKREVGRRSSVAGGNNKHLSVVNQLRTDLSVMMAHINMTVPHFVCCITPVDRAEKEKKVAEGAIPFTENRVAEQLRYGGILEAVKVARSALPHRLQYADFFQRYRWIANAQHEAAVGLVKRLGASTSEEVAKQQCALLIQTLTTQGKPPTVYALEAQIASELQIVLRKRSVLNWMSSIGGVVAEKSVKLGHTKVFLDTHAHTMLEICLLNQLMLCRKQLAVHTLLRVARGMLGRLRARAMRRAQRPAEPVPVKIENVSRLTREVREVKRQDALVQGQITKLISETKAPAHVAPRVDFPSAKRELKALAAVFQHGNTLGPKVVDMSESIREGHLLLRPEKLTAQSTFGKALSLGKGGKGAEGKVTAAVKNANKVINKDHGLFKSFFKVMDRLRELFETARVEKDALEGVKKNADKDMDKNFDELDARLTALERIAKLSRSVYQYYHHYILTVVAEYGSESTYRTSFANDNEYLVALIQILERRQPLLDTEKPGKHPDPSSTFPLYIPSDEQQGPQHQGYLPLCTQNEVFFKVIASGSRPGTEYVVNCMHRLLQGNLMMYPIKFMKIIGKNHSSKGKESFYQAATQFGPDNMNLVLESAYNDRDFSSLVITSLLLGVSVLHPHHVMIDSRGASMRGVSTDEEMCEGLFGYNEQEGTNLLYALPQMDSPVSAELVQTLCAPGAALGLVGAWLRELQLQNKRYAALKSAGFVPADFVALRLPIELPSNSATQVHSRLQSVVSRLAQGATSHSDLLTLLFPERAAYYNNIRRSSPNASISALFQQLSMDSRTSDLSVKPEREVASVEALAAEFMKSVDFSSLAGSPEEREAIPALLENLSFQHAMHFYRVSGPQLALAFGSMLASTRAASLTQARLLSALGRVAQSSEGMSLHSPARVHTSLKTIVLCGLDKKKADEVMASKAIADITAILHMQVVFDAKPV
eukprot:CAMPEP_0173295616 /NCGR_PEP_ID=MMETSP1143-20121109/14521_1 /TAXON_ID=483371 /ORGANISM="non described non described, Strain CCMP2298" /LENGTH=1642 /DNA_ID=CAMNT_0014235411 /DNA_START=95 /DNA_END=5024 /DNA_ORIENTATION=+